MDIVLPFLNYQINKQKTNDKQEWSGQKDKKTTKAV